MSERQIILPTIEDALKYDPFEGDFGAPGDRPLTDKIVTAKKQYACWHCKYPIAIGERHRSRSDISDGCFMSFRWCASCCQAMIDEMSATFDDEPVTYPYEARCNLAKQLEGSAA